MALETYANLAQSTLNGAIIAGDLSLVLTDGSAFPSTGDFRLLIDTEIIRCTARSSNTLTVVRAQEGTTAASHSSGATVTQVLTRAGLIAVGTNLHRTDTYANLPAAGTEGRLFLPTDGSTWLRDDGSAWTAWGPLSKLTATPLAASLTTVNVTTATLTDTVGGLFLNAPNIAAAHGQFWVKTLAAGAYTWIVRLTPLLFGANDCQAGLALRDSVGGKLITFEFQTTIGSPLALRVIQWTDANTRTGSALSTGVGTSSFVWMKIHDDGANRTYSVSADGLNWLDLLTEGRTTWLGTAPNQAGIFVTANGLVAGLQVSSWAGV